MKRRTVIRNFIFISAGTALLPSCKNNDAVTSRKLQNISISSNEEETMAELCETILPQTPNFIGAKDLRSHDFVLLMIDDCHPPEEQREFSEGLKAFSELCSNKNNTSFVQCTASEKKEFLKELESAKDETNAAARFYKTVKGYTIQSFTTSKNYMLDVRNYKMVPGSNFKGCVKIEAA